MEAALGEPTLWNRRGGNLRFSRSSRHFVAVGATIKRCDTICWKCAHTRRTRGAITIEKHLLLEIFTRELILLQTTHIRLHESGQCPAFRDLVGFAAEAFILRGKAGKKCLDELHLAVGQM